jgi:MoxR-like ATPase
MPFSGAQLLLVSRIDRASAETRAIVSKAMQGMRVLENGDTQPIPQPFVIVAAQPVPGAESLAGFAEALLDHFMFSVEWSGRAEGQQVVMDLTNSRARTLEKVFSEKEILALQRVVRDLPASDYVLREAVRLVRATRPADKFAPELIAKYVHTGASALAAQHLMLAAKARAVIGGRLLVTIADARNVALPALSHRISANFTAGVDGLRPRDILAQLVVALEQTGEGDE